MTDRTKEGAAGALLVFEGSSGAKRRLATETIMPILFTNPSTGSCFQQLKLQRTGSKQRSLAANFRSLGAVGAPVRAKLPDELLNREAAAKLLRIGPRTLDRWHEHRVGPPRVAMVGLVRYRLGAIVQWLRDHEVAGPRSKPKSAPK